MARDLGPFYSRLGMLILEARQKKGFTQEGLSKAVGVSRTSITNIEKGRQPVDVHLLVEIATCFEIRASFFLDELQKMGFGFKENILRNDIPEMSRDRRKWVNSILKKAE